MSWASGAGWNLLRREIREGCHEKGEQKGAVWTLGQQAGPTKSGECPILAVDEGVDEPSRLGLLAVYAEAF